MNIKTVIAGTTIALSAAIGSAYAGDQFSALQGITAIAMSSGELDAVKGLHIHFDTPSQNPGHPTVDNPRAGTTGWHFVNQSESGLLLSGLGQALPGSGPGYSGLCGAALLSPAIHINFQNTTVGSPGYGSGGGC